MGFNLGFKGLMFKNDKTLTVLVGQKVQPIVGNQ